MSRDEDSDSSGDSDEEGTALKKQDNLRLLSGSQTNKFAEMLKAQSGRKTFDISQLGYREMNIN